MESSTSIRLTLSESRKVTFYFADTETASLKINTVGKTSATSTYTETLAAGDYEIKKKDTRNLFGIKFETVE